MLAIFNDAVRNVLFGDRMGSKEMAANFPNTRA